MARMSAMADRWLHCGAATPTNVCAERVDVLSKAPGFLPETPAWALGPQR